MVFLDFGKICFCIRSKVARISINYYFLFMFGTLFNCNKHCSVDSAKKKVREILYRYTVQRTDCPRAISRDSGCKIPALGKSHGPRVCISQCIPTGDSVRPFSQHYQGSIDFVLFWKVHWSIGPWAHWSIGPLRPLDDWSIGPLHYWLRLIKSGQ